jgi:ribonuclease P protein component
VIKQATLRRRFSSLRIMAVANMQTRPRIGLIVAKRVWRRSVDRNRAKRAIREQFRITQSSLPGVDVVVQVMDRASDAEFREHLVAAFHYLARSKVRPVNTCPPLAPTPVPVVVAEAAKRAE